MKARFIIVFLLFALAVLLVACGGGANIGATPPAQPQSGVSADAQKYTGLKGDAAKGKTKFDGTCSACHGTDAKGVTGLGKDLTTSAHTKGLSNADFVLFLTKGRPANDPLNTTKVDMPPKGGNPALSDQDLADIVAYVRSLQR
jgi:disulfide bond formation protein DsbB